jgi:hypothetical protein
VPTAAIAKGFGCRPLEGRHRVFGGRLVIVLGSCRSRHQLRKAILISTSFLAVATVVLLRRSRSFPSEPRQRWHMRDKRGVLAVPAMSIGRVAARSQRLALHSRRNIARSRLVPLG